MKKGGLSRVELISQELAKFLNEDQNSYPHEMRRIKREFRVLDSELLAIYNNSELENHLRFNAFYCHLIGLWRQKKYTTYRKLVDEFELLFKDYKLYNAFRAQYYLSKSRNPENYIFAVDYAEKAIRDFPDSPHILHLFGSLVADYQEMKEEVDPLLLLQAERHLTKAIAINRSQYAKYFATKSRIMSLLGKFEEANELIQLAIEKEPVNDPEYLIRIGDYQAIKIRISYYEHTRKIQIKQNEALRSLDEVRNKVIELIGLLSAIIAFVISSVQVSKDLSFENASKLLIILGGVCIVVFSAFSFTFYRGTIRQNQFIAFLSGLLLILFGLLLTPKQKERKVPESYKPIFQDTLTVNKK